MRKIEEQSVTLFDALVAHPDGLDIYQIGEALGLDASGNQRMTLFAIIRHLRLRLGAFNADADDRVHGYTVPIRREGTRYIYHLSARREDGQDWQAIRTETLVSRLQVDSAYWQALAATTDGRTRDGKIARACVRRFGQLVEDIAEIRELAEP